MRRREGRVAAGEGVAGPGGRVTVGCHAPLRRPAGCSWPLGLGVRRPPRRWGWKAGAGGRRGRECVCARRCECASPFPGIPPQPGQRGASPRGERHVTADRRAPRPPSPCSAFGSISTWPLGGGGRAGNPSRAVSLCRKRRCRRWSPGSASLYREQIVGFGGNCAGAPPFAGV